MRRYVATLVVCLLSLVAGGRVALADNADFKFTNNTPETIYLNLYSEARANWRWPNGRQRWVIAPGQKGTAAAGSCRPNEKICYGAGNKAGSRYWGVSLDGKKGCTRCCLQCGQTFGWTLTEHVDPPSRPHTIDEGPALVPADD